MKKIFLLFLTILAPSAQAQSTLQSPELVSPINDKLLIRYFDAAIDFKWGTVSGATQYRFQMSVDGQNFTNILEDVQTGDTQIQLDSLYSKYRNSHDLTLYWRVKAINPSQESDWSKSNRLIFFILPSVEDDNAPQDDVLSPPYPNPFSVRLFLPVSISQAATIQIIFFDLLGRPIKTLYKGILGASTILNWSIDDLPNGTYILNIQIDNYTQSFTVISRN